MPTLNSGRDHRPSEPRPGPAESPSPAGPEPRHRTWTCPPAPAHRARLRGPVLLRRSHRTAWPRTKPARFPCIHVRSDAISHLGSASMFILSWKISTTPSVCGFSRRTRQYEPSQQKERPEASRTACISRWQDRPFGPVPAASASLRPASCTAYTSHCPSPNLSTVQARMSANSSGAAGAKTTRLIVRCAGASPSQAVRRAPRQARHRDPHRGRAARARGADRRADLGQLVGVPALLLFARRIAHRLARICACDHARAEIVRKTRASGDPGRRPRHRGNLHRV